MPVIFPKRQPQGNEVRTNSNLLSILKAKRENAAFDPPPGEDSAYKSLCVSCISDFSWMVREVPLPCRRWVWGGSQIQGSSQRSPGLLIPRPPPLRLCFLPCIIGTHLSERLRCGVIIPVVCNPYSHSYCTLLLFPQTFGQKRCAFYTAKYDSVSNSKPLSAGITF